jgi:hypothetical protein
MNDCHNTDPERYFRITLALISSSDSLRIDEELASKPKIEAHEYVLGMNI